MAPIKQDTLQLSASRISPVTRLYLILPFSLLIFAIIRRFQRRKMSSSQDSEAKRFSRAINISDHSGEKLQLHLSVEAGSPPSNQTATRGESTTSRPEASSTNEQSHQFAQHLDMASLPLPSATQEMKHHTSTLTEREFAQPVYSEHSASSTNPAAPRLQKETVQVFKEVGSESRKNWRRKVLEYR
ncbi:hypothetical protein FQN49_003487 [Arthroderma sp. PD_2]|nr:hypothetical protein FQN49_003487 [Arthroderma sp. PD_2]